MSPAMYWLIAGSAYLVLAWVTLRPYALATPRFSSLGWSMLVLGVLVAFRWPVTLLSEEISVDESQLIAGGITLLHDSLFWRSVDGATAGPLDYFVLSPLLALPLPSPYLAARLTALLLIWAILVVGSRIVASVHGDTIARVALLPAVSAAALFQQTDHVQYSTELVPVLLLALALHQGFRVRSQAAVRRPAAWIGVGILLGSVPLAKLQGSLPALALGLAFVLELATSDFPSARKRRCLTALVGGAVLPALVCAIPLLAAGELLNAIEAYFGRNLQYTWISPWSTTAFLQVGGQVLRENALLPVAVGGSLLFLAIIRPSFRSLSTAATYPIMTALVSGAICALLPRRPYLHYLLFVTMPATLMFGLLAGTALGAAASGMGHRLKLMGGLFLCTLIPMAAVRAAQPQRWLNQAPASQAVAKFVRLHAHADEALAVWGWMPRFFVETRLRQATRGAVSYWEINGPLAIQVAARRRWLADFFRHNPPVFIDAVGPGNQVFNDIRHRHGTFPLLRDHIRRHYTLAAEIEGALIYIRNDRLGVASVGGPSTGTGTSSHP